MRFFRPLQVKACFHGGSFALAVLALAAVAAAPASAQTAAIDFTNPGISTTGITSTRGFTFDITAPVSVNGLSVYDQGADGLADTHDVGLWDSAGTLLASATVPSGVTAPLDSSGKFRFVTLSSALILPVGTGYRVGAVMLQDTTDLEFVVPATLTSAPGVSFVDGAYINNGVASLTFPSSNLGASGISGGSFVVGPGATTAPEPGSLALLVLAGLPVVGLIHRRKA